MTDYIIQPKDYSHDHLCPSCNGKGSLPCEPNPYAYFGTEENPEISCPMCRTNGTVSDTTYNQLIADGYPETKRRDER